ncbi:centromere protein Scm3-domain-containing protein [Aspergillus floccosus]
MESPTKRPRLDLSPEPEEDPDDIDLQEARAQNDLRLKSIFESIFEKYGKDFTEVGDEIDLNTGDIIVNNGHIFTMEGEDDTGERVDWLSDDADSPASISHGQDNEEDPNQEITARGIADYMKSKFGSYGPRLDNIQPQYPPTKSEPETKRNLTESRGPQDEPPLADSEADDDMDSVVFVEMNVQNAPKESRTSEQETEAMDTVTEKAKFTPGTFTQSTNRLPEPVESIWRVPEIDADFSTPVPRRPRPTSSFSAVRSASPPGRRSLWALPWTKKRRNTDVTKKRSAKKPRSTKKHQSSPAVYDWSFAETADASDSDDPLQDNHQPSPTPKRALTIRGKWEGSGTPSRTTARCDFCKKAFSRGGYIAHLRMVVESGSLDDQHDAAEASKLLEAISKDVPETPKTVTKHTPLNTAHTADMQSLDDAATHPTPTKPVGPV